MKNNKKAPLNFDSIKGLYKNTLPVQYTTLGDTYSRIYANGYIQTPIKTRSKAPYLRKWASTILTGKELAKYKKKGSGIVTGKKADTKNPEVIAIDLDTNNEEVTNQLITWCYENIGETPIRIGKHPKAMLIYQKQPDGKDWKKQATNKYKQDKSNDLTHQVEILAKGQYFVAFGIHPETSSPYKWFNGSPCSVKANDLSIINQEHITTLFDFYEELMSIEFPRKVIESKTNQPKGTFTNGALLNLKQPVGVTIAQAERHLKNLNPDMGHDKWVRVGMALWHEFKGDDEAFHIWDNWSSTSGKYNAQEMRTRWDSFKPDIKNTNPVTFASLIKESNTKTLNIEPPKKRVLTAIELYNLPTKREWLIDKIMGVGELGLLFAPPSTYKSFIAIDWALSIATGTSWHGHKVKKGWVLYIFGEGSRGAPNRLKAWCKYHNRRNNMENFYCEVYPTNLDDKEQANLLINDIQNVKDKTGENPKLVVIDTLNKNFGAGNENETKDMTHFFNNIERGIKLNFDCSVLVVHHTVKNNSKEYRGSGVIKGSVDFSYRIEKKNGQALLINDKQKDAQEHDPMYFELQSVLLEIKENEEISSLVPALTDAPIKIIKNKDTNYHKVFSIAKDLFFNHDKPITKKDFATLCVKNHGFKSEKTVFNAIVDLKKQTDYGLNFDKNNAIIGVFGDSLFDNLKKSEPD